MKHILFALAMMPSIAFAQKLQLGLNTGVQYNGIASRIAGAYGRPGGYISARMLKDLGGHLQIGITVDAGKITNRLNWEIYTDETLTQKHKPLHIIASPYIAPSVILNYKKRIMSGYAYAGLAVGYTRGLKSESGDVKEIPLDPGGNIWRQEFAFAGSVIADDPSNWLSLGVQGGYTLPLHSRWALNAEVAARYMTDDLGGGFLSHRTVYFPASIGVRCGL